MSILDLPQVMLRLSKLSRVTKLTASFFAASLPIYDAFVTNYVFKQENLGLLQSRYRSCTSSLKCFYPNLQNFVFVPPPLYAGRSSNAGISSNKCVDQTKVLKGRFRVGDYYVWLYHDEEGVPTSWEKYTVTHTTADEEDGLSVIVTIEMSTKFAENDPFAVHHRMKVNLKSHVESESVGQDRRLSSFEYLEKDADGNFVWKKFGTGDNVQAFEEKFDVFTMLKTANDFNSKNATVAFQSEEKQVSLCQSKSHKYTDAWYGPTTDDEGNQILKNLSGVALIKYFKNHSFKLIQTGNFNEESFDISVITQESL